MNEQQAWEGLKYLLKRFGSQPRWATYLSLPRQIQSDILGAAFEHASEGFNEYVTINAKMLRKEGVNVP